MNKYNMLIGLGLMLFGSTACDNQVPKKTAATTNALISNNTPTAENTIAPVEKRKALTDFLPKEQIIFDTIYGDLNKDGLEDCIVITKGTNKKYIIQDEYRGELDRNRRGLIVLLNGTNGYEAIVKNYACFSSENEDGGVYFPPELNIEIEKGKLFVHFAHGRYGYWRYSFRYKANDFELIGYDQSDNHGPIVSRFISCNFLTKKKLIKENINMYTEEPENEVFKETWKNLKAEHLPRLSTVNDFDNLDVSEDF